MIRLTVIPRGRSGTARKATSQSRDTVRRPPLFVSSVSEFFLDCPPVLGVSSLSTESRRTPHCAAGFFSLEGARAAEAGPRQFGPGEGSTAGSGSIRDVRTAVRGRVLTQYFARPLIEFLHLAHTSSS